MIGSGLEESDGEEESSVSCTDDENTVVFMMEVWVLDRVVFVGSMDWIGYMSW